jgi:hypothetical protein
MGSVGILGSCLSKIFIGKWLQKSMFLTHLLVAGFPQFIRGA